MHSIGNGLFWFPGTPSAVPSGYTFVRYNDNEAKVNGVTQTGGCICRSGGSGGGGSNLSQPRLSTNFQSQPTYMVVGQPVYGAVPVNQTFVFGTQYPYVQY